MKKNITSSLNFRKLQALENLIRFKLTKLTKTKSSIQNCVQQLCLLIINLKNVTTLTDRRTLHLHKQCGCIRSIHHNSSFVLIHGNYPGV